MKSWVLIIFLASFCIGMASCSGDSGAHAGKDTVKNVYGSANDTTGSAQRTIDTGKATSDDNSASGGTKAIKDTGKQKSAKN